MVTFMAETGPLPSRPAMKKVPSLFIILSTTMHPTFAKTFRLISMMAALCCTPAQAVPPPNSFGVWDRGDKFDRSDYPFLKGLAFTKTWADVEKEPGVFDWSSLDQAMKKAVESSQFLYLSLNVGPDAPKWIYDKGVPAVKADSSA